MPSPKFTGKSARDESRRPIVNVDNYVSTGGNKILEDILKCGFRNLASAFSGGSGGGGSFTCTDVADCIENSEAVQDALEAFIESGNFVLEGTWLFNDNVTFNDQVDFVNGPVNFDNLTIDMDNVDVNMDINSTFTNAGDTFLTGNTTIEDLTVNNLTLGGAIDLTDLISADVGNQIVTGTDNLLYVPASSSFDCSDVADCIDNDATVQEALSNWFIDALSTDVDLQNALDTYVETFIEAGTFILAGDWDFQGNLTLNGAAIGTAFTWQDEVPAGAINSINTVFTLTQTPIAESISVYLNGLRQRITTDYGVVGTTLTFVVAPSTGATLDVHYTY